MHNFNLWFQEIWYQYLCFKTVLQKLLKYDSSIIIQSFQTNLLKNLNENIFGDME